MLRPEANCRKYPEGLAFKNDFKTNQLGAVAFHDFPAKAEYLRLLIANGVRQTFFVDSSAYFLSSKKKCNYQMIRYIIHLKTEFSEKTLGLLAKEVENRIKGISLGFMDDIEKVYCTKPFNLGIRQFRYPRDDDANDHYKSFSRVTPLNQLNGMLYPCNTFDNSIFQWQPEWCIKVMISKLIIKNEYIAGYQILSFSHFGCTMTKSTAHDSVENYMGAIDKSAGIIAAIVDSINDSATGKITGDFYDEYLDKVEEREAAAEEAEILELTKRLSILTERKRVREERIAARKKKREEAAAAAADEEVMPPAEGVEGEQPIIVEDEDDEGKEPI